MYVKFNSCSGCVNKGKCIHKEEYEKIDKGINNILKDCNSEINYQVTINVKCNLHITDCGRGLGM